MLAGFHTEQSRFAIEFETIGLLLEAPPSPVATPFDLQRQRGLFRSEGGNGSVAHGVKIVGGSKIGLFVHHVCAIVGVHEQHGQRAGRLYLTI